MRFNFKVFLLSLMATLALSALNASIASAVLFHSETTNTEFTGEQPTGPVFDLGGKTVECSSPKLTGTLGPATAETVDLTPSFGSCTAFGYATAPVNTTGCKYRLNAGGSLQFVTSPCAIDITPTFFGASVCTVKIEPGSTAYSLDFANEGSGSSRQVLVTSTATGIPYKETGGGCALSPASGSGGNYTGAFKLKGSSEGSQVGIRVGGEGAYFHSDITNTEFTGEQPTGPVFDLGGKTVECSSPKLTGTLGPATAETVDLTPSFGSCTAFGYATAHVNTTGCKYRLNAGGSLQFVTSPCAIDITPTFFGASVCTVKIEPGSTSYTVDYANEGSGSSRQVLLTSTAAGITYKETGGGCGLSPASGSSGSYTGSFKLKGSSGGSQVGIRVE